MSERASESRVEQRTTTISPTIGLVSPQSSQSGPRWAIIGIFFILLFGALYLAASFVLPVVIALLFALVLSPVVRFLRRRLKVWEPISAFLLVIGALATLISGFYMLSDPITQIVSNAPRYVEAVDAEMRSVQDRIDRLRSAQQQAETSVEEDAPAADDQPQEVVVKNPDLLDSATTALPEIAASIAFSLIFLFFLLASGDLFYQKLIKSMPTLSDKKRALHIAHDIERELSRYLFTITMINIGLGVAVGSALWWVGMPTPMIFGALATLLNFIPYIGSLLGIALVGVIALAEFGSLAAALAPVLLYLACTTVEGQFVTPLIVGRRLEMNAAAIFLAVAFWGWIWGVVGMFLAVPVMVAIKVFASYIEPLGPLGDFLSVESKPLPADDEES
ncbi:MAG: AI-2E family transporter [Aurantimonas endophytica]|uniref:Putative PurR-regulated permease PerM n=1 Tax=Aurantimonas endophytica TaxID=1522175 RepID=A0A7W6HAH3_9HYPH|nr:AI-2E family transporter [Aurantimonas endophytica]MBB4001348.1 putative PurR-regulated permease PerM [Aurantimonas endophytica]